MSLFSQTDPVKTIPSRKSSAQDWIQWHKDLKDNTGKKLARSTTSYVWKKRGNNDAVNPTMKDYFAGEGISIERTGLASILDTKDSLVDNIGNIFSVGKYTVYAITGIAVVGLGMIVFNVARNPIKAAQAAASFTPAGRAAGAIK